MKGDHRKPPDPPHWGTPRGSCRWCGCCVYRSDGRPDFSRHWHGECVGEYKFIFWPNHTRLILLKTRGERCEDCGKPVFYHQEVSWVYNIIDRSPFKIITGGPCEHHHIIPLSEYQHDPRDPYAAWREGNLVLLCHACHQARHAALRREKKPQMRLAL